MKHLCFPASYARLSEEEQCETIGGGDLRSAWSTFTDNLHFGDFSMGSGLLTFSISFVPMLLFTAVKNTVSFAYRIYNKLLASSIFRLGTSTSETVQHLAAQQETNSFPLR